MCILKPSQILKYLHEGIKQDLRQDESGKHAQDGMDMALCTIDPASGTLQYAGARNSIYLIRERELEIVRADHRSIGGRIKRYGSEPPAVFTDHVISLDPGTAIYMFSDGYMDQFGGEEGEKFGMDRFKELLIEHSDKPMEQQKSILIRTMEEWQKEQRQVDDRLIIGIRM